MISTVDLYKEIKIMEDAVKKEKDDFKKASLKAQILNLKLLHNIRTNTVKVMEHFQIEKVKPKKTEDVANEAPATAKE